MKPLTLILSICISISAFAQHRQFLKPDYDAIKTATHDKSSAYYYPSLMERYRNNDTTLGVDDFKYLYYGYFFNKNPADSFSNKDESENKEIDELLSKDNLADDEVARLSNLCLDYLNRHPFDLRRLNIVYQTKRKLVDTIAASKYHYKTRKLIGTILNSGDGKTDETGFHVLEVSHEYFMLKVFGYESTGQTLTPHPCDYLTLKSNPDNVAGIYFDVSQIFVDYNEMFKGVGEDFLKDINSKKKKRR